MRLLRATLPERIYNPIYYLRYFGPRAPRTFREKLHYTKLFRRDPSLPSWVDKIDVKALVAEKLGKDWIIPHYFAGAHLPPVEERSWPLPYVIKPSHRSGDAIIARSRVDLDWPDIETRCAAWTADNYGVETDEWFYRGLERRIMVEKYVGGEQPPPDFKFFVFHGRARMVQVDINRFVGHRRSFYDLDWRKLPISMKYPQFDETFERPRHLREMIEAAEKLAEPWSFARVDFYDTDEGPKFGEVTFIPEAGFVYFDPPRIDDELGALWRL
jgi:hypothetical protein